MAVRVRVRVRVRLGVKDKVGVRVYPHNDSQRKTVT
jgi:hypothetical protein